MTKKRGGGKKKKNEEELADVVVSWSVQDVLNKDLFKDKVTKIPDSFQSVNHYHESFVNPLLEETRTDLCSCMESLSQAPVLEIEESRRTMQSSVYTIKLAPLRTAGSGGGRGHGTYIPRVDDILLFSQARAVAIADLSRVGETCVVGAVVKPSKKDRSTPSCRILVKVSKPMELLDDAKQGSLLAVFLMSITPSSRIWRSLSWIPRNIRNLSVINSVLDADLETGRSCSVCSSTQDISVEGSSLRNRLLSYNLNESQIDAVLSSVLARQCSRKHSVKLIWGPPGTGKTKTVSTLLQALMAMKCRTLICAPTNVAISEVSLRLLRLVRESCQTGDSSLGDIVLFGNKDRLNINDDLEDIFLDYRVDRLAKCVGPSAGWKHKTKSMISFLEECFPRYKSCLKNKKKKKSSTFRKFVQQRFRPIAKSLTDCIRILRTHLPTAYLSEPNLKLMNSVCDQLQSFESLLGVGNITDKELEEVFMHSKEVKRETFQSKLEEMEVNGTGAILLRKTKNECLRVLRTLDKSFHVPHSRKKDMIRNICLRNASLIFCTVSTSFKLHSVKKMKPLEFLVIDEAAQLKECESTIPLQLLGIKHAVLIGDDRQLPAIIKSKVSEEAGFGRSLFERLSLLGHEKHLLSMQYRMHPSISFFPNVNFYANQILDAPNVRNKNYRRHYILGRMFKPYSFINVAYGKEIYSDGHSPKNMVEVAVTLQLVRRLFEASLALKQKISVCLVSPYTAQVSEFQERLGKTYEMHNDFVVNVKSIDGFQGGEEDVIIISTVRSNRRGEVGFLHNLQRTNVALTRARHCLWILGNEPTLTSSGCIWKEVVVDAKRRGCFFNADDDIHLAEAMIPSVVEHGQFDDLLHTDSLLFKRARWRVQFNSEFRNSFAQIKETAIRKEVIKVLMKLSSGCHPKNGDLDLVDGSSFQLLKQYKIRGLRLIWTVDILEDSMFVQVLKIWDIIPAAELPKLIKLSNNIFEKYSKDHLSKCKYKCRDGELCVPMNWKISPDEPPANLDISMEDLLTHWDSLILGEKSNASTSQSSNAGKEGRY